MRSSPKAKGDTVLPTIEEPIATRKSSIQDATERKESSTAPPTFPSKPPSTRILDPPRPQSQNMHTPSVQRANGSKPQRPNLQHRRTTARTRYMDMLLGLDSVSPLHNILASASVWILLAGYIVFPATFTQLHGDSVSSSADNEFETAALKTVRNVPLLYVAAFACGIGVLGCLWLWWKHRANYVWVINRIFLPALMNSVAGLISTLVNVYSAQEGVYSVTARATVVVTAACSVVAAALFLLYNTIMLRFVKMRHKREVRAVEKEEERRGGLCRGGLNGGVS